MVEKGLIPGVSTSVPSGAADDTQNNHCVEEEVPSHCSVVEEGLKPGVGTSVPLGTANDSDQLAIAPVRKRRGPVPRPDSAVSAKTL